MSAGGDLATLMTAVAHQLRDLSPEELRHLLAGDAQLRYVPNELATVVERLRQLPPAEAQALVDQLATPPRPAREAATGRATRKAAPVKAAPAAPTPAGPAPAAPTPAAPTLAKAAPVKAAPAKAAPTRAKATSSRTVKADPTVAVADAPAGPPAAIDPAAIDPAAVRERLSGFGNEADATAFLTGLGLELPAMRAVATGLGLRVAGKNTVAAIAAEIVRVFVRGRLNTAIAQRL